MERDPMGILFPLFSFIGFLAVCLAVASYRARRHPKVDQAAKAREDQARARQLVAAGTHVLLDDGNVAPRCRYCEASATHRPYEWLRDSGAWDLIRRTFGAPARVRIGRDPWSENSACAVHDPLVFEQFRIENAEFEVDRAKLEANWETRRARFQREGVHERVLAQIEKHQRESGRRGRGKKAAQSARVVPLRTGTDR